jgi:hypothetical protein
MGFAQSLRKLRPEILAAIQDAPQGQEDFKRRLQPMSVQYQVGGETGSSTQIPESLISYLRKQSAQTGAVPVGVEETPTPNNLLDSLKRNLPVAETQPRIQAPAIAPDAFKRPASPVQMVDEPPVSNLLPFVRDAAPSALPTAETSPASITSPFSRATPAPSDAPAPIGARVKPPVFGRVYRQDTGNPELDDLKYERELQTTPVQDHNGRLKSALLGALRGYAGGGLGGAIAGGLGGAIDKSSDEKFARQRELGQVGGRIQVAQARQKEQATIDALRRKPLDEQAKRDEAEWDDLRQVWSGLPEFDPKSTDPEIQQMVVAARRLGKVLPKKEANGRFSTALAQDGTSITTNTRTGEVIVNPGNYAKPTKVTGKDLPDALLGVPSDDEIETQARASTSRGKIKDPNVAQKNGTIRQQIEQLKKEQAANEQTANDQSTRQVQDKDGRLIDAPNVSLETRRQARARADHLRDEIGNLERGISVEETDEPDSAVQQRVATRKAELLKQRETRRQEAENFRARVESSKPTEDDAPVVSRADVAALWVQTMAIPDEKERKQKLADLYEAIRHMKIQ